jgi:hypothetical protein
MREVEEPPLDGFTYLDSDVITASSLATTADPLDQVVGQAPPEHTWVGKGFVWMLYAFAAGCAIAAFDMAAAAGDARSVMLLVLLFFPAAIVWLARSVEKFRLAGFGSVVLALLAMFTGGVEMVRDSGSPLDILLGGGLLVLVSVWTGYFLTRFRDFT